MVISNALAANLFMDKIEPEPNTGCWLWLASLDTHGYGHVWARRFTGEKKLILAHRLSWMIFLGAIPPGKWVLHTCDTPSCCSPEHLFLGTRGANSRDMAAKNRGSKSKNGLPFGVFPNWKSYSARVAFDGMMIHLGTYKTKEQAAEVASSFKQYVIGIYRCMDGFINGGGK